MTLFTAGYACWPTRQRMERLIEALGAVGVNLLIDIRHSPCSSNTDPATPYGPRHWNLQTGEEGVGAHLQRAGIGYEWLVELGNPQKNDPEMAVLREHLLSEDLRWPVNRGLYLLRDIVQAENRVCCVLCACENAATCHRRVIAEKLRERFFAGLKIEHIRSEKTESNRLI